MNFHKSNLPLHENGMTISAYNGEQLLLKKPITPLVAALLLMKSILVNPKRIKLKYLILINMLPILQRHLKGNRSLSFCTGDANELALRSKRRDLSLPFCCRLGR